MAEYLWSRDHKLQKLTTVSLLLWFPKYLGTLGVLAGPEVGWVEFCDLHMCATRSCLPMVFPFEGHLIRWKATSSLVWC